MPQNQPKINPATGYVHDDSQLATNPIPPAGAVLVSDTQGVVGISVGEKITPIYPPIPVNEVENSEATE